MKKIKIILSLFIFGFSLFFVEKSFADAAAQCASQTGYVAGQTTNQSIIVAYTECIANLENPPSTTPAPPHPGEPPLNTCSGLTGAAFTACQTAYQAQADAYQAAWNAYNQYQQGQTQTAQMQSVSATKTLEDIAAKQQKAAEELQGKSSMLKTLGMALIAAGLLLLALPIPNPVGYTMIAAGGVLLVYGFVTGSKANKLLQNKQVTCEQYNKVATKPIDCPAAQIQTGGDGVIPIITSGTGAVPSFIDPVTGLCRPGAPIECKTITKNLPAGCFKQGGACIAGIGKNLGQVIAKNGQVTMNLNGKQRTFGIDDFSSEKSMVAAGFTPAQAKQFFSDLNSANGILAQNGLNIKGELKSLSSAPMVSGAAAAATASGPVVGMKTEKDNYGPAVNNEREPASAEGLTKDYHGDTIGADGDNVFKMITRRYKVKKLQNIFIEE